jgi:phosphoribosylanthranilate isomerase
MFQIKICGITNENDAIAAAEAGADAIGLNFYSKSPRFITQSVASRIIEAIPNEIVKVGLFVNEDVVVVASVFDTLGLDLIQLHGDEEPDYLLKLGNRPVMKAFRLGQKGLKPIEAFMEKYRKDFRSAKNSQQIENLSCVLIDSYVEGVLGGSGIVADWNSCANFAGNSTHPPLVLAGGLTPNNIADAIRKVHPTAVDTASGVETSPGIKDRQLLFRFVENARRGFLSKDS